MTIEHICTFLLNGSWFGIAVGDVQEIIRQQPLTRIPLAPPDVCGLMNLRGQVIPVVDLPCRLGLRSLSCGIGEEPVYNVIVHTADDVVSFIVDDVGDVQECAIETLEPPPATLNDDMQFFLKGAYKLDRDFLLVLNTERILDATYRGEK